MRNNIEYGIWLQHLRASYGSLFPGLWDCHPGHFPREVFTWEQFLWATEVWYTNALQVRFEDGVVRSCLVPVAGTFRV